MLVYVIARQLPITEVTGLHIPRVCADHLCVRLADLGRTTPELHGGSTARLCTTLQRLFSASFVAKTYIVHNLSKLDSRLVLSCCLLNAVSYSTLEVTRLSDTIYDAEI